MARGRLGSAGADIRGLTIAQEVHILHEYPSDFYAKELRVVMLGFIRPEFNYAGLGARALAPLLRFPSNLADLLYLFPNLHPTFPCLPLTPADALIKDINTDKLVASTSVTRAAYAAFASDPFFTKKSELSPPESDPAAVRVKPGEKVDQQAHGVKVNGERE